MDVEPAHGPIEIAPTPLVRYVPKVLIVSVFSLLRPPENLY